MNDAISRRDLVALTGMGLATSACSPSANGGGNASGNAMFAAGPAANAAPDWVRGRCIPHGLDPHDDCPYEKKEKFHPPFIALVVIDFSDRWKLSVNHASFLLTNPLASEDVRRDRAIELLAECTDENAENSDKKVKKFRELLAANKPYPRSNGDLDLDDFIKFGFKNRHEIFIYFNNEDVEFDDKWLISFTEFNQDGIKRAPNHAFFRARRVKHPELGALQGRGQLIRVENYVTNSKGKQIDPKEPKESIDYAMNIHFKVKAGGGRRLAMIIDPDTGNGAGNEP